MTTVELLEGQFANPVYEVLPHATIEQQLKDAAEGNLTMVAFVGRSKNGESESFYVTGVRSIPGCSHATSDKAMYECIDPRKGISLLVVTSD